MNPFVPALAEIVDRKQETSHIFTLRLRLKDKNRQKAYQFKPGQFNMVYALGVGEVPISIVSDPTNPDLLDHTIRTVGTVTTALEKMKKGHVVGLRGPFGSAWPLEEAQGKNVIIVTGGLGCAPTVSVINYVVNRRPFYGTIKILHGVKTPKDLLYRNRFRSWQKNPNTEVFLTVDHPDRNWKYRVGVVTNLFDEIRVDPQKSVVMLCGPEVMMRFAVKGLLSQRFLGSQIFLSLERNMKCAIGFCGHCQFGPSFVCKDGPVYRYDKIQKWFNQHEI
ncbi:MAG TPA: FAD/NAD(P)-binding protein [Nitrospiria bacterium]|jgi:NAD(P)H-flavin reductase